MSLGNGGRPAGAALFEIQHSSIVAWVAIGIASFMWQAISRQAAAQEAPPADVDNVVAVGAEPFPARLISIDESGTVHLLGKSPFALSRERFVRWGHPARLRPQPVLLLSDGSRLVTAADWSGGAAVRLASEQYLVVTDMADEVAVPRGAARGLVFAAQARPEDRERLARRVGEAAGEEDQVWLANEDRLQGRITELGGGSLTLAIEGGDVKLPLSRVEAIVFAASGSPAARAEPRLVVGLRDGSLLWASEARADERGLSARLAGGVELTGNIATATGTAADIVSVQSTGGESFVYLSDLEPLDYRHVPYLGLSWPCERDRNVLGEPLRVGGQRYLKGIGMHSAARLTYRLDGGYRRLEAEVALDDSAGGRGSVTFGVYLLVDGQWREAYQSGMVRGGEAPRHVSVETEGATGITLTVDYADRGDELDRANWLDARLVK